MKCLLLALRRLKRYYEKDRLIFLLYLLSSVTCVLMFLFAYGNLLTSKYMEASTAPAYRRYTLPVQTGKTIDTALFEQLAGEPVESVQLSSVIERNNISFLSAFVEDSISINALSGRGFFTEEELQGEKPVIILSRDYSKEMTGKIVTIADHTYEVVGVSNRMSSYIPLSCYLQEGHQSSEIQITLARKLSIYENNLFLEKLNSIFQPSFIENPADIYRAGQDALPMDLTLVCSIYLLVFLSFTFLIKYMADRSRYESVVYSVVGASRKAVFQIILLEVIFMSAIAAFLAIVIHKVFYSSFFCNLNMFENLSYSIKDYLIVFIGSVSLSCCTLLPFLIRFSKESLAHSRRRFA